MFTFEGIFAGFLYIIIYLFSTFGVFYAFIIVKPRQFNAYKLLYFKNFSSLKVINPFLLFIISIFFLSLAGIPPLSGFISKFFVFSAIIELNYIFIFILLLIVSLVSAYYYIRPVKLFFFYSLKAPKFLVEIPYLSALILTIVFFFNLVLMFTARLFFVIIYDISSF